MLLVVVGGVWCMSSGFLFFLTPFRIPGIIVRVPLCNKQTQPGRGVYNNYPPSTLHTRTGSIIVPVVLIIDSQVYH